MSHRESSLDAWHTDQPMFMLHYLQKMLTCTWSINWSPGRNDECNIGEGWYKFKKDHKLKAGQHVKFSRRGYENQFIVQIV